MEKKVVIVYKGLTGEAERSPDDNLYRGVLLGISPEVVFEGANISDLQLSFTRAVDAYRDDTRRSPLTAAAAGRRDQSAAEAQGSI
jgi:predicted HicB family RNase H-like nuclease